MQDKRAIFTHVHRHPRAHNVCKVWHHWNWMPHFHQLYLTCSPPHLSVSLAKLWLLVIVSMKLSTFSCFKEQFLHFLWGWSMLQYITIQNKKKYTQKIRMQLCHNARYWLMLQWDIMVVFMLECYPDIAIKGLVSISIFTEITLQ